MAENLVLASWIRDLESADGVTRNSPSSCETLSSPWEGCRAVSWNSGQGCSWVSVGTWKPRTPGILPFCALLLSMCRLHHPSLFRAASSASWARVMGRTLSTCRSQTEILLVQPPEKCSPRLAPHPRCPCLCLMLSPGSVFLEIILQCGGPLSWRAVEVEGLSGHSELGHTPQRC